MIKADLMNTVSRTFHNIGFKFQKHSPEILVVAGVVGAVTSAVMACRATTKLGGILDKAKEDIDTIHKVTENPEMVNEEYTLEDSKKDLTIVYAHTALDLVKLYAPAVILGALSVTSILASNNILRKRNVALAAAYTVVDKSFKEYRGRVVERFGEELDKELRFNVKAKEVEKTIIDEKGKEKKVKTTIYEANPSKHSEFTRCFDEGCFGWSKDHEFNIMFLHRQQDWLNERLKSQGYLFLNDAFEALGFNKTPAGQAVGWIYDPKNPDVDSYVDFGIYDINDPAKVKFVNGWERNVWLDFNVDGNITHVFDK